MAYTFYMDGLILPVTPDKLITNITGRNKTLTLINDGEVNLLREPGLTEITFTARLPGAYRPYADFSMGITEASNNFLTKKLLGQNASFMLQARGAKDYLDKFEKLKTEKKPFVFLVIRETGLKSFSTNLKVSLEEYSIKEEAENGLDIDVEISLKQYKDFGLKEIEITEDETGQKRAVVKSKRNTDISIEREIKIGREKSIWEAVQRATNGQVDYKRVMSLNGLDPFSMPTGGRILKL